MPGVGENADRLPVDTLYRLSHFAALVHVHNVPPCPPSSQEASAGPGEAYDGSCGRSENLQFDGEATAGPLLPPAYKIGVPKGGLNVTLVGF